MKTSQTMFWIAVPLVMSCAKTVLELGAGPGADAGRAGGAGAAGGVGGAGAAGGGAIVLPPSSVSPWQGNASDCPSSPPTGAPRDAYSNNPMPDLGDSLCEVGEGETCAYHFMQSGLASFQECSCYEQNRSIKRWACSGVSTPDLDLCPMDQPASGSTCSGYVGLNCPYPPSQVFCSCPGDLYSTWSCNDNLALPDTINKSPPPDTSAAGKRIVDLRDAEVRAWCAWYSTFGQAVGAPAPRPSAVTADGYVTTGLYVNWDFFGDACLPAPVAEEQCVQNLELLRCEATLGELTDCVMTIHYDTPQPHGCGRFFEAAHCEGTIVRRTALAATQEGGFGGGLNPDHSENCGSIQVR